MTLPDWITAGLASSPFISFLIYLWYVERSAREKAYDKLAAIQEEANKRDKAIIDFLTKQLEDK